MVENQLSFVDRHGELARSILARFIGGLIFVRTMEGKRFGGALNAIYEDHIVIDQEPVRIDEIWKIYNAREVIS